jgi:hypothetical protein
LHRNPSESDAGISPIKINKGMKRRKIPDFISTKRIDLLNLGEFRIEGDMNLRIRISAAIPFC